MPAEPEISNVQSEELRRVVAPLFECPDVAFVHVTESEHHLFGSADSLGGRTRGVTVAIGLHNRMHLHGHGDDAGQAIESIRTQLLEREAVAHA